MTKELVFYLKRDEEYWPLSRFDESTSIYGYFKYYLLAPGITALDDRVLKEMIECAFEEIRLLKKKNSLYRRKIDEIKAMDNTVPEKLEEIFKIKNRMRTVEDKIDRRKHYVSIMKFLIQMNSNINAAAIDEINSKQKNNIYGEITERYMEKGVREGYTISGN